MSRSDLVSRFEKAALSGSEKTLIAFLATLSEEERSKLAPKVNGLFRRLNGERSRPWADRSYGNQSAETIQFWKAAPENLWTLLQYAQIATLSVPQLVKADIFNWVYNADRILELIRHRSPEWLSALGESVEARSTFYQLHALVAAGVIPEPESEHYVLGLVNVCYAQGKQDGLLEYLRANPDILDSLVWRLFEVEGDTVSLSTREDSSGNEQSWRGALVALAVSGEMDRGRLLDASLAALTKDWAPRRAQWMSIFHLAMEPTEEERSERQGGYVRLLGTNHASFAVKLLRKVDKDGALDKAAYLQHAGPAVVAPAKVTALAAIQMVVSAADADPARATALLQSASTHPLDEVRRAATAALGQLGAAVPQSPPRVALVSAPALEPVTASPGLLAPIDDLTELQSRLTVVLEDPSDPDEFELVLDALVRFCAEPAAPKALAPLVQRAEYVAQHAAQFFPVQVRYLLPTLLLAWANREDLKPVGPWAWGSERPRGAMALQVARWQEIGPRLVARDARPLLSTPTHAGGWLDEAMLAQRLEVTPPGDADLALALLRLPRTASTPAVLAAARSTGGIRSQQAVAIGEAPQYRLQVGTSTEWHKQTVAQMVTQFPLLLGLDSWAAEGAEDNWVRLGSTTWPRGMEATYAAGVGLLTLNLEGRASQQAARAFLELLLNHQGRFGPAATTLAVLGLSTKKAEYQSLAVDTLVEAATDGRLTSTLLTTTMSEAFSILMPSRVAATLDQVRRAGEVPAVVVRDALLDLLPSLDPTHRGIHTLVAVVADAGEEYGIPPHPTAKSWLTGRTGALGKQAKRVLALQSEETP